METRIVRKFGSGAIASNTRALFALRQNLDLAEKRIEYLVGLLENLFADEEFVTLLKLEGITTMPSGLARRLAERTRWHPQK